MRMLASWNFGNAAVTDETNRIGENAAKLHGLSYPDQRSGAEVPVPRKPWTSGPNGWASMNANCSMSRAMSWWSSTGPHYLHWTQAKEMATKIAEFLR